MAKLSKNHMESRPKAIKLMNKNIKYNPVKQCNNTSGRDPLTVTSIINNSSLTCSKLTAT